jgi:lipopolysaccharide/colanic/teichoic acid biosynthesis glycosyltransferase
MKSLTRFFLLLLGRIVACILLIGILPALALFALLIDTTGGSPIFVTEDVVMRNGATYRFIRFRTTGHGTFVFHMIGRFLRLYTFDLCPAFWSVVRGDIGLRDLRDISKLS